MPKLKTHKSAEEALTDAIREKSLTHCGGLIGLCRPMGCSTGTVYGRIKNPGNITIRELRAIRGACGLTREELLALLGPLI